MRRMTRAAAVVCVTCAGLVGTATTTAALPADALDCGDTVSGPVALTEDLQCDDVGLVLEPGAVLDLGGHALVGPGRDVGGVALETVFEDITSDDPVVVRNGQIHDWGHVFPDAAHFNATLDGVVVHDNAVVAFTGSAALTLERSTFRRNGLVAGGFGIGVEATGSVFADNSTALSIGPPGEVTVRRSTFTGNGAALTCSEGRVNVASSTFRANITAVSPDACSSTVESSSFLGNGTAFVSQMVFPSGSPGTDRIAGNRFVDNDVALDLGVRTLVEDNVFLRNGTGMLSESAGTPGFEVEEVTVLRNVLLHNGDGVVVDSPAQVGHNVAIRNDGFGLNVPRATDLGGNVAFGNGVDCIGVDCAP